MSARTQNKRGKIYKKKPVLLVEEKIEEQKKCMFGRCNGN